MNNKEEIKKLIYKLIKKSFPVLKDKKIYVSYFFISKKYSGAAFWLLPSKRIIFINQKRKLNNLQLTGLIAHELGHLELFEKSGWIRGLTSVILYWTSSKFRKKEEEKVIKLAIERGYSREHYNFTKKVYGNSLKNSEYYWAPEKIKKYAEKIGKWQK